MTPPVLTHAVAGDGPPLVLLNGGLMSMRAWDPVATILETKFKVIRCDLRGQLLTPGPPPPTVHGHAADVVGLLGHLGVESAHVVGVSFGGIVGLALAVQAPARVRSLVAMNTTGHVPPEMWPLGQPVRDACRAAAEGGDGGAVLDLLAPATYSPAFRQKFARELATRRQLVASIPKEWFAGLEVLLGCLKDLDLLPSLGGIRSPTLVLAGGADLTFPVQYAQVLASRIPGARLHIVPDGSHAMAIEEPDVIVEVILHFVMDVENARRG